MARFCTRENEPLKKWNGIPIYLTTILTAVFVAGLFFSAILMALRSPILDLLKFTIPGDAWTFLSVFTYPFIGRISFFTIFGIAFFYWFSVGIETHLGRAVLGKLLALLVLLPVAVAAVFWYGFGESSTLISNDLLVMGLLIAFATVYPRAEFWGWIPFKWVAFACLVCGSMMELAERDWLYLAGLWANAAGGFLYMRRRLDAEYDDEPAPAPTRIKDWFRRKPKFSVLPTPTASSKPSVRPLREESDTEVDALLDKIAKSGLSSLTRSERAKLERARQELLKKEQL